MSETALVLSTVEGGGVSERTFVLATVKGVGRVSIRSCHSGEGGVGENICSCYSAGGGVKENISSCHSEGGGVRENISSFHSGGGGVRENISSCYSGGGGVRERTIVFGTVGGGGGGLKKNISFLHSGGMSSVFVDKIVYHFIIPWVQWMGYFIRVGIQSSVTLFFWAQNLQFWFTKLLIILLSPARSGRHILFVLGLSFLWAQNLVFNFRGNFKITFITTWGCASEF